MSARVVAVQSPHNPQASGKSHLMSETKARVQKSAKKTQILS